MHASYPLLPQEQIVPTLTSLKQMPVQAEAVELPILKALACAAELSFPKSAPAEPSAPDVMTCYLENLTLH